MTTLPSERRLHRFDGVERAVHWANAVLFLVLLATAAALYVGPVAAAVGRRTMVRDIHVWAGLLLPVPLVLGLVGRWGRGFRADVRRLNRFSADDRRWIRSVGGDERVRFGKFHPGQKLNAAFTAGVIALMLGTGAMMRWFTLVPLSWRQGATFVHDWLALASFLVVLGHIWKSIRDRHAMRGIVTGTVPATWAEAHHPRWAEEAATD